MSQIEPVYPNVFKSCKFDFEQFARLGNGYLKNFRFSNHVFNHMPKMIQLLPYSFQGDVPGQHEDNRPHQVSFL